MFLFFLFSILLLAVICGLFYLLIIYFRFNSGIVYSREETDFANRLIEKYDDTQNLCAVVKCSPERNDRNKLIEHKEMTDCRLFFDRYGVESFCKWGCIGYGSCAVTCPQHAISIRNGTAVVGSSCIGCGKCVDVCPQKIIELVPREKEYFIQCAAPENQANEGCSFCCTSCGGCNRNETLTLEIAKKCPQKCIKKISNPVNKGFKF